MSIYALAGYNKRLETGSCISPILAPMNAGILDVALDAGALDAGSLAPILHATVVPEIGRGRFVPDYAIVERLLI